MPVKEAVLTFFAEPSDAWFELLALQNEDTKKVKEALTAKKEDEERHTLFLEKLSMQRLQYITKLDADGEVTTGLLDDLVSSTRHSYAERMASNGPLRETIAEMKDAGVVSGIEFKNVVTQLTSQIEILGTALDILVADCAVRGRSLSVVQARLTGPKGNIPEVHTRIINNLCDTYV